ncbi:HAMP domain-containing sensor histidine kinase [Bacillus sp. FJAT-27251]|uniref:sensor histidine kinase n=1 Tax=Bacillus sp. FJAT-27251 TaxID=1684142 RepID=UPI0006A7EA51|nr:HAMP domain-containing sensor histidine kinase [Bacillus sp. FJAT-27251]
MRMRNRLVFKLLGSIAISFGVSFLVLAVLSQTFFRLFQADQLTDYGLTIYNTLMLIIILVFIAVFLALVRGRMIYLKEISERVHEIAGGNLGLTIDVNGEDELAQLARNINFMSKELEGKFEYERNLERSKNELITNVSHDLRTPLTSIIGYLDLIRKGQYRSQLELNEYVEMTYAKSQRLNSLIDELFEYTRLSSPDVKLNLEEVDLSALLEQMLGEYIPIFDSQQMTIEKSIIAEPVILLMDVEKMVRVYENILINAKKYSEKPSVLKAAFEVHGSSAVLRLSNKTEKPIKQEVNQLFERFVIGETSRSDIQGTGLGLAISKRIVELHGGHITAEYSEGWLTIIIEHRI